jgi:uncharacterized membrane protein
MVSETGLALYFWGVYVWYILGFLAVAIPAIFEVVGMFRNRVIPDVIAQKEDT